MSFWRDIGAKTSKALRYPIWGTVIAPDARVDPTRFADDDFPVHCPKCEYLLRGVPSGICPECGQPFDRGRLLVEQYVLARRIRTRLKILEKICIGAWVVLGVFFLMVLPLLIRFGDRNRVRSLLLADWFLAGLPVVLQCFFGLTLITCAWSVYGFIQYRRRGARKARRVLQALAGAAAPIAEPDELVTVFAAESADEADFVAIWLSDNGVPAAIKPWCWFDDSASTNPACYAPRGIEVCVAGSMLARAANVLLDERGHEIPSRSHGAQSGRVIAALCSKCRTISPFPVELAGTVQECPECRDYLDVPKRRHAGRGG